MCSGSGQVKADSQELESAQTSMVNTLNANYNTAFANQQAILNRVAAQMAYQTANPMGYTAPQLAQMTTSINENTATAARQAIGAAASYAASHGGADIGGGPAAEVAGEVGSQALQSRAVALANVQNANQAFKYNNYWNAVRGLSEAGAGFGTAAGTAAGTSAGVAGSATSAGQLALEAGQTTFQDIGAGISAVGGLATGAGAIMKGLGALSSPGAGATS